MLKEKEILLAGLMECTKAPQLEPVELGSRRGVGLWPGRGSAWGHMPVNTKRGRCYLSVLRKKKTLAEEYERNEEGVDNR